MTMLNDISYNHEAALACSTPKRPIQAVPMQGLHLLKRCRRAVRYSVAEIYHCERVDAMLPCQSNVLAAECQRSVLMGATIMVSCQPSPLVTS